MSPHFFFFPNYFLFKSLNFCTFFEALVTRKRCENKTEKTFFQTELIMEDKQSTSRLLFHVLPSIWPTASKSVFLLSCEEL